jgi:four helix bundle protein
MPIVTYRDLIVWKQSMSLVEECYKLTVGFPNSELYGLTSQLRRAAVSIPANVAEGHRRRETKPYRNHVSIAIGSHGELETYLELAHRLGLLSQPDKARVTNLADSVGRLLFGLHRSLKKKLSEPSSDS